MTITVTVEELRAHDAALNKWHYERVAQATEKVEFGFAQEETILRLNRRKFTDYEKNTPKPTLIPPI
jgi:hypothetical protein